MGPVRQTALPRSSGRVVIRASFASVGGTAVGGGGAPNDRGTAADRRPPGWVGHAVLVAEGRVEAAGVDAAMAASPDNEARATVLDLEGWCLLPAPAEAHAHLDKAFLAERAPATGGDVRQAVQALKSLHASMTVGDLLERARRAALLAVRHGCTALRSHVDVGGDVGTRGLRALCELRAELHGVAELQIVALPAEPVAGRDGAGGRRWLDRALREGAEVVGGAPWLDVEPGRAIHELAAAAAAGGHPLDLHMDETTDAAVVNLARLADRVSHFGLGGRTVASHCVSLGQQTSERALQLGKLLADAGVSVVSLPQTNLYLQGRDHMCQVPRGLPPLALLADAGVLVAGGGDNWRDPFNPLGRADPFETASLLVAAGHVEVASAYRMVSENAREVMGLRPAALRPGDDGDLVALRAATVDECVSGATEERVVVHAGQIVARTELKVSGRFWP